ncbi:MAG TPA: T9SS type B sorting domain-containing protein, partial [Flavobacteriaceae bacterium]|nr:T9SS type B sorting domain-containing protein [Flavobacteriaceae bacterium]
NPDQYTYHWYEANDMNVIIGYDETLLVSEADLAQSNGVYVLKVTDLLGCTYSQFTSVSMAEQMIITDVSVSDFNRLDNTIIVEVTGGSGVFEYTLHTIDYAGNTHTTVQNNPRFDNLVAGTYQIEVLDMTGCSISVTTDDIYVLDYPPFFTPNGDLQHDTWQITGANFIPNSKIYIFDRFGKVLAQVDPQSVIGWDGTYNGIQVPASDYWFTCEYIDPNNGQAKSVKGHFSIVRK